jgi:hypothetical protein
MEPKFETMKDCFSMESRIIRHHGYFYHPRTSELIIGIEGDIREHPSFASSRYKSLTLPAIAYHNQQNRTCGVQRDLGNIFAVSPNGICTIIPKVKIGTEVIGKKTSQWKSVWFSKGSHRA